MEGFKLIASDPASDTDGGHNHDSGIGKWKGRPPTTVIMARCKRRFVSRHGRGFGGCTKCGVERGM